MGFTILQKAQQCMLKKQYLVIVTLLKLVQENKHEKIWNFSMV